MSTREGSSTLHQENEERVRRFEERMAEGRPKRTKHATLDAAIEIVGRHLTRETGFLKDGQFQMAAQEQAQREKVRDLEWLIEDLQEVKRHLFKSEGYVSHIE